MSILSEREKTHGDYGTTAVISQKLKTDIRNTPNWEKLTETQRESLEMIAVKIARLLAGSPNDPDHWNDISGYADLAANHLVRMPSIAPGQVKMAQDKTVPEDRFPSFLAPNNAS